MAPDRGVAQFQPPPGRRIRAHIGNGKKGAEEIPVGHILFISGDLVFNYARRWGVPSRKSRKTETGASGPRKS
jgi:hypothetical protein